MAVRIVFPELFLQRLYLLIEGLQLVLYKGNSLIPLRQLFLPLALFSSLLEQYFFGCYLATLSTFPSFDKSSMIPS